MQDDIEKVYKNKELITLSEKEFYEGLEMPKIQDSFIAKLEWALLLLSGKYSDINYSQAIHHGSLKTFDGAWLLSQDRLGINDKKQGVKFLFPFKEDQVSPDMFPEMNMKILQLDDTAFMQRVRLLSPQEKRNLNQARFIVKYNMAFYNVKKEKWFGNEEGYCFNGLSKAENIQLILPTPCPLKPGYFFQDADIKNHTKLTTDDGKDDSPYMAALKTINMAFQMQLTAYYEWFVYFRETPESVGVKIPIYPESWKEIFALRDLPEGEKRRKAICHFVREHYRTLKSDYSEEEREVLVRKHLRGETKFNWRGLDVNLIPAKYDIKRTDSKKKFMEV